MLTFGIFAVKLFIVQFLLNSTVVL